MSTTRKQSAIEPAFSALFGKVEAELNDFLDSIAATQELWEEWEEHVSTWRFTPEELTAELICEALQAEIRDYVGQHTPPEHWPGSQHILSQEWCTAFCSWLFDQPLAGRMLRRSIVYSACFHDHDSPVHAAYVQNVSDACLEHIRQRAYEPWATKEAREQADAAQIQQRIASRRAREENPK